MNTSNIVETVCLMDVMETFPGKGKRFIIEAVKTRLEKAGCEIGYFQLSRTIDDMVAMFLVYKVSSSEYRMTDRGQAELDKKRRELVKVLGVSI